MSTRKKRNSRRRSGSRGSDTVTRQSPKKSTRNKVGIRRGLFNTLKLLSPRTLGSIKGEISSIESVPGKATSFFMRNERGPVMLVSHAQRPDRNNAAELAADLRKVYGNEPDADVPSTLVMHVARGNEDAARELASGLIDVLNINPNDSRRFALVEGQSDTPDDNTVGLVFTVVEQGQDGTERPVGRPEGREEASDDSGSNELVATRPRSDAIGPAPENGAARRVPDDPDADLRSDVDLVPIIGVEAFKQATRERGPRSRSAEYQRMLSSLEGYHRDLGNFEREMQVMKAEMGELGRGKLERITALNELKEQRKQAEKANLGEGLALTQIMTRIKDLRSQLENAPGEAERSEMETEIQKQEQDSETRLTKLTAAREEIAALDRQIAEVSKDIAQADETLNARIQLSKEILRRYKTQLDGKAQTLKADADAYLSGKPGANNSKVQAVRELSGSLSDAAQNLQRLKEVSRTVWSTGFRNQLAAPARLLNTGTASEVFRVETNGNIGDSGRRAGFAKRGMAKGMDPNDTSINLGFGNKKVGDPPPSLIARQVLSSRLDRHLDMNVTAAEVFSVDADGRVMGITAEALGKQVMMNQNVPLFLANAGREVFLADQIQVFSAIGFTSGAIQKQLSDLQLMDALTGQMDRHTGNLFIDPATGKVTAIDNDMAFPIDKPNAVSGNTLNMFSKDASGNLVYNQELIDRGSAQKILALTEQDLRTMLAGKPGDPEHLEQAAIDHAVTRLNAMKEKIRQLENDGMLIDEWGGRTYALAIRDNEESTSGDANYLGRALQQWKAAADPAQPLKRQEVQGV